MPEEPDPGSDPGPDPGPEVADTLLGWSQYGTNGDYDNYEVRSYHLDVNQSGVADHSHPGNFYNWPAATAGTGTYAIAAQYQNAPDSICPKGWKLPVGDQANSAENQFVNLLDSVSYDAALNDPFWFILPGVINYSDSLTGPGFMGYYWTRSNSSSQKAYIYDISNSVPGSPYQYQKKESSQNVKGDGYSIRCMKEIPIIMQEVQALDYSSVARNTTFKMMDERDGKYYYVTKEADGNLWMTQNLDLDLELDGNKIITRKNGQAVEISKDNTNITADAWTTAQSNLTTWTDTGIGVYDSGNKCQSEGIATSLTDCTTTSGSANQEHVGNFYTWTAATAGSTIETGSATTDICPSGWRLPTGGEFNSLLTGHYPTNGSNRDAELLVTPFWFLRAGYYADDGSIRDRGSYGRYWSGTADGANFAYNLYFGSDIVGPGTYNGNKSSGRALRCIKEVPIIMQEVQSSDYNSVTTGTTFKMMDNRDGKVYYVTKEGDGHLWMTQNLDLDLKISNGKINAITTNNSLTLLTNQNTDMTASNWSASSVSSWAYSTSIGVYNPGGKCIAGGTATTFSDCVSGVANHEHIGNYYSWTAATAGSAITTGNATTSICPAGWHLPIGNYGGEIQNLLNGVSSSNILNSPFWFLRTGSYGSYEVKNLGTIGLYWTSTAQDSDFSYRLYFSDHSVYQGAGADLKLYGLTIRCMK